MDKEGLDSYLGLCAEVYDISKPEAPQDAYAFYKQYAIAANGQILEPMCGTGRFLIPMLEDGFDVQGFDASEHMLAKLHEKLKAKGIEANVWFEFAQNLNRSNKYNLIFIPSGSFCLMLNRDEVKAALKKFYEHLNDGGVFVFEAETPMAVPQENVWRESIWEKPNGQKIILNRLATMTGDICTSTCKYDLVDNGQILHTEAEEIKVIIYRQHELIDLLKEAGFSTIRILKAFDFKQQPDDGDESVVYECRK